MDTSNNNPPVLLPQQPSPLPASLSQSKPASVINPPSSVSRQSSQLQQQPPTEPRTVHIRKWVKRWETKGHVSICKWTPVVVEKVFSSLEELEDHEQRQHKSSRFVTGPIKNPFGLGGSSTVATAQMDNGQNGPRTRRLRRGGGMDDEDDFQWQQLALLDPALRKLRY